MHESPSLQIYTAKANTVWKESENMLSRIINNTVGTGIAVAVIGTLAIVLFVIAPPFNEQYVSSELQECGNIAILQNTRTRFSKYYKI